MNPYDSPRTGLGRPLPWRTRIRLLAGLLFGLVCVAIAGAQVYYAHTLRRDYPGLSDPSPNVDGYWPALAHSIAHTIAGVAALLGVPVLGSSLDARRSAERNRII
ncbi:MAG: hypothetical protein KDA42_04945 [Planctomycetales bacterium]|nr:hypothetical protein [Planctomycetales bacterium]